MRQTRRQKLEFKFRTGQITPREMDEFTNKTPTRRSLLRDPAAWLLAFLVVSVLLTLAGCGEKSAQRELILTDAEGCAYMARTAGGTWDVAPRVVPLLDKNGKQVCK